MNCPAGITPSPLVSTYPPYPGTPSLLPESPPGEKPNHGSGLAARPRHRDPALPPGRTLIVVDFRSTPAPPRGIPVPWRIHSAAVYRQLGGFNRRGWSQGSTSLNYAGPSFADPTHLDARLLSQSRIPSGEKRRSLAPSVAPWRTALRSRGPARPSALE